MSLLTSLTSAFDGLADTHRYREASEGRFSMWAGEADATLKRFFFKKHTYPESWIDFKEGVRNVPWDHQDLGIEEAEEALQRGGHLA